jgi:hypothetical protein
VTKVVTERNFELELNMSWAGGPFDELNVVRAAFRGLGMTASSAKSLTRSVPE